MQRGSNVYVAFLDFSKAFDTISHSGLFTKLINRDAPLCFLLVIMFWYLNMEYDIKWAKARSNPFKVLNGSKQGGVLSPDFFAVYINDLIAMLKSMGLGCHVINLFIACLLFADDMSVIAPTREALQQLLNTCASYCQKFCLKFNVAKTKVMVFGKFSRSISSLAKVSVGDVLVDYVEKCKYLGFYLTSHDHFKCSVTEDLRGFFGSVNSILTSTHRPMENILMQLLYANCVPKLTYGAEVKDYNASEKNQLNVALNGAIRRIFGFRFWQSIRQIRDCYGFKSMEVLIDKAKRRFTMSIENHANVVLRSLAALLRKDEEAELNRIP